MKSIYRIALDDSEKLIICYSLLRYKAYLEESNEDQTYIDSANALNEKIGNIIPSEGLLAHQQRVVEEKKELDKKLLKLSVFFDTDTFSEVEPEEQARLKKQSEIMTAYSILLNDRIAAF
jgi:hypothetical protein